MTEHEELLLLRALAEKQQQELAEGLAKEKEKITVPAHTRKAGQPGVRAEMLSGLVQEIEEYIIPRNGHLQSMRQ